MILGSQHALLLEPGLDDLQNVLKFWRLRRKKSGGNFVCVAKISGVYFRAYTVDFGYEKFHPPGPLFCSEIRFLSSIVVDHFVHQK